MTSLIMPEVPTPRAAMVGIDVMYDTLINEVHLGIYNLDFDDVDTLKAFLASVFPLMIAARQEELRTTPTTRPFAEVKAEIEQLESLLIGANS